MTFFHLFFYGGLLLLVWLHNIPYVVPVYYLLLSLLTFIVYAKDKHAAKQHTGRVRERTLHLLALLGGWTGANMAQAYLRHKTQKRVFAKVCVGSMLLHTMLWGVLLCKGYV